MTPLTLLILLALLAGLVGIGLLLGRMRSWRATLHLPPQYRPLAPEAAPLFLRERAAGQSARLTESGFEDDGPFEIVDDQLGPQASWLWRHAEAGTLLTLHLAERGEPGRPVYTLLTVLADGWSLRTTSADLESLPPLALAGVLDDREPGATFDQLWERHLARVQARVEETGALPQPLEAEVGAAWMDALAERTWAAMQGAVGTYTGNAQGLRLRWGRCLSLALRPPPATPVPADAARLTPEAELALALHLQRRAEARTAALQLPALAAAGLGIVLLGVIAGAAAWLSGSAWTALAVAGAVAGLAAVQGLAKLLLSPRKSGSGIPRGLAPAPLSPWRLALMQLAGPLLALLLGCCLFGSWLLQPEPEPGLLVHSALAFLAVGALALLPLAPLPGGKLFEGIFLPRVPRLSVFIRLLAGAGLGVAAYYSGYYLLGIPAAGLLVSLPADWRTARSCKNLRRGARRDSFLSIEHEAWLRRILRRYVPFPPGTLRPRLAEASRLAHVLRQTPAGFATLVLAFVGWTAPLWLPLATVPVLHHLCRRELSRAQAEARGAGLVDPAEAEFNLRKRLSPIVPAEDARADYGAAIAGRGRNEAQVTGMVPYAAWDALRRGAGRRYWPQDAPAESPGLRRLRQDGLDPRAVANVLSRRLEQVMVADEAGAIVEVAQLARRVAEQIGNSPRWDEEHALPEFWEAWCLGLERALILRAEKRRPLAESTAALLAAELPAPAVFTERVHLTFGTEIARLEDSWRRLLARPERGLSPESRLPAVVQNALLPLQQRIWAESLREAARMWSYLAKGFDPWGRKLPGSTAPSRLEPHAIWATHRAVWRSALLRTDLARGALAWHATWARGGQPTELAAVRAPWFEGPAEDPTGTEKWRLEARGANDQRFVLEPKPGANAEPEVRWELTKLQRVEP